MNRWLTVIMMLFWALDSNAQSDSLSCESVLLRDTSLNSVSGSRCGFLRWVDRNSETRLYQMTYIGVPLVVGALIIKSEDAHFRSMRQSYAPSFRQHYDDYLQYAPAALMLGLKVGGVKGRSSWGRMLVSDAFSVGIMAAVVNPIKLSARVMRPDGSSRNSFPSGHTATAFMTATMLHKEYGWRSPWYSIAGYSIATVTGVSRMLNNRHWLSDVMAGAGIGILSAELGYYFADLIFKERGLHASSFMGTFDSNRRPSFFGFHLGFDIAPGIYHPASNASMDFYTGSSIGVEGAWFASSSFGVGGQLSLGSIAFSLNGMPQGELLKSVSTYAGGYFSCPLSLRWIAGAKLQGGYCYYDSCYTETMSLGRVGGFSTNAGVSMLYRAKSNMSVRFFLDYKIAPPVSSQSHELLHIMTLGGSIDIGF